MATTVTGHVAYPIGMPRLSGHPDCFLVSNKQCLIAKLGQLVGCPLTLKRQSLGLSKDIQGNERCHNGFREQTLG